MSLPPVTEDSGLIYEGTNDRALIHRPVAVIPRTSAASARQFTPPSRQ
ncbi:MAG: hypothetical protein M0010_10495 [Actinomycetota bacterium]|nr:hypothetical protein [Actinomycetota bacterium]